MNIGIIINSSWNIYNFRQGLVRHLLDEGHQVTAIAPDDGYGSALTAMGCDFCSLDMDNKGSNPLRDSLLIGTLVTLYRQHELDLVLHYTIKPNIYGSIAAALVGIPSINNVTGLGTVFIRDGITSKIAHTLYRLAFLFPKVVFFQNKDDREIFLEKNLVNRRITDVLPGSGIDLEYFQPKTFKRDGTFTFLMIARVLYDKGIVEYVEAARRLRAQGCQARFQLLGKIEEVRKLGVSREQVNAWQAEGLIEYLGTAKDVRPHIHEADCVVLPSYREGVPRTLIEACSLAKPIITTDVPGCRETVVHGYNGYICEVKNAHSLAHWMSQMIALPMHEREKMALHSRALAESRFDESLVIRKYQAAIEQIFGIKSFRQPVPADPMVLAS